MESWLTRHLRKVDAWITRLAAAFTMVDKLARRSSHSRETVAYLGYSRAREDLRLTLRRLVARKRRLTPPPVPARRR